MYEATVAQYLIKLKEVLAQPLKNFADDSLDDVPKKPGVYVIYDKKSQRIICRQNEEPQETFVERPQERKHRRQPVQEGTRSKSWHRQRKRDQKIHRGELQFSLLSD
jgi:hypothetical protein